MPSGRSRRFAQDREQSTSLSNWRPRFSPGHLSHRLRLGPPRAARLPGNSHADANLYPHPHVHTHTNAYGNADVNPHQYRYTHTHVYLNTHVNPHKHPYTYFNA
jgi:hypothetical protein